MQENDQKFQRQVAYKVLISEILNAAAIDGQFSIANEKVSRVNIIALSVYKPEDNKLNMIVDDGTGKINLRSFEYPDFFLGIEAGDPVIVVGRIRDFNNERYIMPEIVKKLEDYGWVNFRKVELKGRILVPSKAHNEVVETKTTSNPKDEIYSIIRILDIGDGVPTEDVIKKSKNPDAENIINSLLGNGDVFEIRPGRLKVLE